MEANKTPSFEQKTPDTIDNPNFKLRVPELSKELQDFYDKSSNLQGNMENVALKRLLDLTSLAALRSAESETVIA